jgi:hypothetical protein
MLMPEMIQPISKGIPARENLDNARHSENGQKDFKRF